MSTIVNGTPSPSVVLAAVDLTPASGDILQAAAQLARTSPAELHLVNVMPLQPMDPLGLAHADRELQFANQLDRVKTHLRLLVQEACLPGQRIGMHVRSGIPQVEIAQLAGDIGADLLIVGTHGRTGFERIILGSVAETLVRHAPCAVLVHRRKASPIWEQITPACPDCLTVQRETKRAKLWCERHSEHHARAHTYSEIPASFGVGSQTFR